MKYHVSVMFEIDTSEYADVGEDPAAVLDLIRAMLRGDADLPEKHEARMYRLSPEAES